MTPHLICRDDIYGERERTVPPMDHMAKWVIRFSEQGGSKVARYNCLFQISIEVVQENGRDALHVALENRVGEM